MPSFDHDGLTLHYGDRGERDGTPIVLVHGLLWSGRMFHRLADLLDDHRVLLLDVRGHGPSTRPTDPAAYRWSKLASDVTALLDHLGLEQAVVGGLSLGANVALAVARDAPERVSGLVVEMPVLDQGATVARPLFTTLATALRVGRPVLVPVTAVVGHVPAPRSVPEVAAVRDVLALDPAAGAALIRGLLVDELLLADLDPERLTMPALVVGHHGDPLHPMADARALVDLLPAARLVERHTILDHRVRPDLLADELAPLLEHIH